MKQIKIALLIDPKDNVAIALQEFDVGDIVEVKGTKTSYSMEIKTNIPKGHKASLSDFNQGDPIVKYGVVIGKAVKHINKGELVHIHNLQSVRWSRGVSNEE